MSDDVRERGCEAYGNELAELALGVLTGRERARVLSHVESCPRCADELELLSRTADTVVQAAPEMEPPLGFEVRLFERMGVTDSGPPSPPSPPVALGAGRGGRRRGGPGARPGPQPDVVLVAAADRERAAGSGHAEVETAALLARTARRSVTSMTVRRRQAVDVDDAGRFGAPRDGATASSSPTTASPTTSGPSWPDEGYGAWIAPLPRRPGRRAHGRGGVAQRDGDRHRHAGLTTVLSTGRCRACRGRGPARRCSRPAPGSAS